MDVIIVEASIIKWRITYTHHPIKTRSVKDYNNLIKTSIDKRQVRIIQPKHLCKVGRNLLTYSLVTLEKNSTWCKKKLKMLLTWWLVRSLSKNASLMLYWLWCYLFLVSAKLIETLELVSAVSGHSTLLMTLLDKKSVRCEQSYKDWSFLDWRSWALHWPIQTYANWLWCGFGYGLVIKILSANNCPTQK